MFTVYTLEDADTQEIRYVGLTRTSLKRRLSGHKRTARCGSNRRVYNWLRKCQKIPSIKALETHASLHEAQEAEKFFIAYFKYVGVRLTNLTEGGEGTLGLRSNRRGIPLPIETKEKISRTLQGHSYNKGIPKTKEHRQKLSDAKKGVPLCATHSQRISAAHKKSGLKPPSWAGKTHTEETKNKMRVSAKTPPRAIVELTTMQCFVSVSAAALALKVRKADIFSVLSGRSQHYKGYIFKDHEGRY